jgi:hypothetical protein
MDTRVLTPQVGVLQQAHNTTGSMQERTIIDGQQPLSPLQPLLDGMHAELDAVKTRQAAMRVDALVSNAESKQSPSALWHEYVDQTAVDVGEADRPDENEDE